MSHHWRDVTLVNKAKKRFGCEHRNQKCECAQFALRNITRPYKDYPVFKPYIRDGKFALENETDK